MKMRAFTLAETLIVIGIIGVVAALTLPNLNHATGDKETVTRLMKAYSMLNEANDRVSAIYGEPNEWQSQGVCMDDIEYCWMTRIGEFLKAVKSCDEYGDEDEGTYSSCNQFSKSNFETNGIVYTFPDGMTLTSWGTGTFDCNKDTSCLEEIYVDINGPKKGKNEYAQDIFRFKLYSDRISTFKDADTIEGAVADCLSNKDYYCTFWPIEYGNLDYLKADEEGKCNDNPSIILDGVNNTSCH